MARFKEFFGERKKLLALLIIVALVVVGFSALLLSRKDLEPGIDDFEDLFVGGREGYPTYRIPALLTLPDGTVLAFCEGRASLQDHGKIDLVLKRYTPSTGWSPLKVLVEDGQNTVGNPAPLFDLSIQTVFLLFSINNEKVMIINSTDFGLTWSSPREITSSVKRSEWQWYATGPGHAIQLQSGRLLVPCDHGLKKPDGVTPYNLSSHVIYSDDHGNTWNIGYVFDYGDECMAVETNDSKVYLTMRQNADGRGFPLNNRLYAWSSDGGVTFSDVKSDPNLIEPRCQASVVRLPKSNSQDRERILFVNPASQSRDHLTIKVSNDNCGSWSAGKTIFKGPSAYSDIQIGNNQQIYILFERGSLLPYEKITFVNTTLNWVES